MMFNIFNFNDGKVYNEYLAVILGEYSNPNIQYELVQNIQKIYPYLTKFWRYK